MGSMEKYWCKIPVSIPWKSSGHFRDVRIWLLDNVPHHGSYHFDGVDFQNMNNRVYYFEKEKDAALFALRWS